MCLVELEKNDAETIFLTINDALQERHLSYEKLVTCSFDGAANFSNNIRGVSTRISQAKGYDLWGYIYSL